MRKWSDSYFRTYSYFVEIIISKFKVGNYPMPVVRVRESLFSYLCQRNLKNINSKNKHHVKI